MIERIKVVLPAPLRPTRLTIAPRGDMDRKAAQRRHRLNSTTRLSIASNGAAFIARLR